MANVKLSQIAAAGSPPALTDQFVMVTGGNTDNLVTGNQIKTTIGLFGAAVSGLTPASGGGSTNFLRADGTWASPGGGVTSVFGRTGAVVAAANDYSFSQLSGSIAGSQIPNSTVTLAMMANEAANTVLGNNTGSPAAPIALTTAQLTAMINNFTSGLAGDVPASGGGTANFLRADGTWAPPPGGGGGTPGGSNTDVQFNQSSAFGGDSGFTYAGNGQATLALGTITTNLTALNITATWNASGVKFDAPLFMNITNTASAATSLLADFQVGGTTSIGIGKSSEIFGASSVSGGINVTNSAGVTQLELVSAQIYGYSGVNIVWDINRAGSLAYRTVSTGYFSFGISTTSTNPDTILTRGGAAATLQQGAADAAAPVAQTLQVQSVVAGTSNTAGVNWTHQGSLSTGTGAPGNITFNTGFANNTLSSSTVTITIASPGVITLASHGLVTGSPVSFATTGTLPTGIVAGTTYYAIVTYTLGTGTFEIATTPANAFAGTAINTSGSQSGTQTVSTVNTAQNVGVNTFVLGPACVGAAGAANFLTLNTTWNAGSSVVCNGIVWTINMISASSSSVPLLIQNQQGNALLKITCGGAGQSNWYFGGGLFGGAGALMSMFGSDSGFSCSVSSNGGQCFSFRQGTANGSVFQRLCIDSTANQLAFGCTLGSSINSYTGNAFWTSTAAATIQQGAADAAAPVAQITQVQSVVAGTSNTAGALWTINGSKGTGTGAGGDIAFQCTPNPGVAGATAQNTLVEVFRILAAGNIKYSAAASFSANGSVATTLGSVGPTGSNTTVQKWLTIVDNGGATRYIPCF